MKIIIEFYAGKHRLDAWQVDTQDLVGKPKILKVHLYRGSGKGTDNCYPRKKPL